MFGTKGISEENVTSILQRVSEYEIFRYYCSSFIELGKKFNSPFRAGSNSLSCAVIPMPSGRLVYKDFVTGETLSCFSYVEKKYGCSREEALNIISNDFKVFTKKITPSLNYVGLSDKPEARKSSKIFITKRRWLSSDTYWDKYSITRELLDFYQVVPLAAISIKNDGIIKTTYRYSTADPAYSYEHGKNLRKILRPYAERSAKWISNLPRDIYSGYHQLDEKGDLLIITKSLKDVMIWRKAGINSIAPQGESIKPSEGLLEMLKLRFKTILINYDNDHHGKRVMKEIEEETGLKSILIDPEKDVSDYVKNNGFDKNKILNFIKNA